MNLRMFEDPGQPDALELSERKRIDWYTQPQFTGAVVQFYAPTMT
jgi:hypothetical protein